MGGAQVVGSWRQQNLKQQIIISLYCVTAYLCYFGLGEVLKAVLKG